jgi:hypothetical protein
MLSCRWARSVIWAVALYRDHVADVGNARVEGGAVQQTSSAPVMDWDLEAAEMSETIYELIEDLITAAQREGESWEWGENMNARKREAQKAKDKLRDEIAKYSASIAAKDAEIERLQTWLDEAQSACKGLGQTADNFGARLNAARAEVERLRDMELQADVEHEIWSSWMRYMFTCGTFNDDETWTMPSDKVERWRRQADTPYSELSEREKESDREQVRKHWEAK